MAISTAKGSRSLEAIIALLGRDDDEVLEGYVDYNGYASKRSKSGGWRSAAFIAGQETRLIMISLYLFINQNSIIHVKF